MLKELAGGVVALTFMTGVAVASVDLNVRVGLPVPQVKVIETERVVVVEKQKKDNGRHLGQKKNKKHKWKKHD